MNKEFKNYLQLSLFLIDIITINVCFFISKLLINELHLIANEVSLSFLFINNIIWLILIIICGVYFKKSITHFETFTKRTVQAFLLWILLGVLYLFISNEGHTNKIFITICVFSYSIGLILNRFLYLGIRNYFKHKDYLVNKIIILGYNETAIKLASYFEEESINSNLIGFVENYKNVNEITHYPILSEIKNLINVALKFNVKEIYSTISPEQNKSIYSLMQQAENNCIHFRVVPNLSNFFNNAVLVDYIRDLPILSNRHEPLEDIGHKIEKRIFDIFISGLVIIFILSWLIPLLAIIIKMESKGPLFFSQKRTGKNNLTFDCLKFRSMKINKDADFKQASQNDNRITKVGKFIRKTSLDEFPQFLNVFIGQMSIVGPRPHMVKHTNDYSKIVDDYMVRHFLKPGITGWAQINGFRGEIKNPLQIKMRIHNDIWYLENWNVWLDLKIIFITIYSVFKGDKKAY